MRFWSYLPPESCHRIAPDPAPPRRLTAPPDPLSRAAPECPPSRIDRPGASALDSRFAAALGPPVMNLSPCKEFLLEDSSSSDESDIESLLERHPQQMVVVVLVVKEHEDRNRKRWRGSTVGCLCIPRNRHLGNEMLMQDYFTENPTYLSCLFRRRYRMC
ncbi:Cell division cycle 5-like protein [Hordeum vulgare]|nr:Cell division cycle 5-like protein [Hordeum vulgare]